MEARKQGLRRRRVLTNHILDSLTVMQWCWESGVDLPPEPKEYRGSGVALEWGPEDTLQSEVNHNSVGPTLEDFDG